MLWYDKVHRPSKAEIYGLIKAAKVNWSRRHSSTKVEFTSPQFWKGVGNLLFFFGTGKVLKKHRGCSEEAGLSTSAVRQPRAVVYPTDRPTDRPTDWHLPFADGIRDSRSIIVAAASRRCANHGRLLRRGTLQRRCFLTRVLRTRFRTYRSYVYVRLYVCVSAVPHPVRSCVGRRAKICACECRTSFLKLANF